MRLGSRGEVHWVEQFHAVKWKGGECCGRSLRLAGLGLASGARLFGSHVLSCGRRLCEVAMGSLVGVGTGKGG